MLARAARLLATVTAVGFAVYAAGSLWGRTAGVLVLVAMALAWLTVKLWLPRLAHRAFNAGNFPRARTWYRVLRVTALDRFARASVRVSLAACELALDRTEAALRLLEAVDRDRLTDAARAAWLNNRAYALARAGRDLDQARADADEAVALRPDVAGFRHTRGVVLLALGDVADAIRELEAVWKATAPDAPPLLEAERCYDLGVAWSRRGELEYARDYFDRARRAAPESRWAVRAAEEAPPMIPDTRIASLV